MENTEKSNCNDCDKDLAGLVSENYNLFLQFIESNHLASEIFGYVWKLLSSPIKENQQVQEMENLIERAKGYNVKFSQ